LPEGKNPLFSINLHNNLIQTIVADTWPVYTTASDAYAEIGVGGVIASKTGVAAAFGTP
jgi:hypothetical protein